MRIIRTMPRRITQLTVLIGLLAGASAAARAQITTHTALPITEGRGVVRMMTRLVQASGPLGKADRELTAWAFPAVGVYGETEKLAMFGIVPIVTKSLEVRSPRGTFTRSAAGRCPPPGDGPGSSIRASSW